MDKSVALCLLSGLFAGIIVVHSRNIPEVDDMELMSPDKMASIVGGMYAKPNEIPYQVYVRIFANGITLSCGGSIIGPRHVLAAAHCFHLPKALRISVVYGDVDRWGTSSESMDVVRRYYYKAKTKDIYSDVVILKVEDRFPLSRPSVKAVHLQKKRHYLSKACIASGWGDAMDTSLDEDLLKVVVVPIIGYKKCKKIYVDSPPNDLLCAGFHKGGKDTCVGDSGGPLVCDGLLTGVIRGGAGCGELGAPGTYSEVAYYYDWIQKVVNKDILLDGDSIDEDNYFNKSVSRNEGRRSG